MAIGRAIGRADMDGRVPSSVCEMGYAAEVATRVRHQNKRLHIQRVWRRYGIWLVVLAAARKNRPAGHQTPCFFPYSTDEAGHFH